MGIIYIYICGGIAQWAYVQWACMPRVHAVGMACRGGMWRVHAWLSYYLERCAESKAQPGKLPGSYGVYQGGAL